MTITKAESLITKAESLSIKRDCILYMENHGYEKVRSDLPLKFRNYYLNLLGNFFLFIKRSREEEQMYIARSVNYLILSTRHERMKNEEDD